MWNRNAELIHADIRAIIETADKIDKEKNIIHKGKGTEEHHFKKTTYLHPQWCDFCGRFLWGSLSPPLPSPFSLTCVFLFLSIRRLKRQGYRCGVCGMNVHGDCREGAGYTCPWE